jgi:site-specific recombinase XerC
VSEVAALKVGDIDSTRMPIRVEQEKGRKDRNAMLTPQLLELLRRWWREGKRRNVMLPHGWLFPDHNYLEPVSTRQLNRAVHGSGGHQEADDASHAAPQLRNPHFGSLEAGTDIRIIQVLQDRWTIASLGTPTLNAQVSTAVLAGAPVRSLAEPRATRSDLEVADVFHRHGGATDALRITAADPRHLGAAIGVLPLLQTWATPTPPLSSFCRRRRRHRHRTRLP